ncbi:MAG: GntR family transcriptional regulator [Nocardioidaceae bacterium]|nr:GntR family transcriptional regulator [Nocardioidaceae bacterium]NUS50340.1 GntR family transcriptional regulator [Nocardioidaceae bacterium]
MSVDASSDVDAPDAFRGFRVNRSSPIPLYFQLSQHLEQAIESGTIPHGTVFRNEIQLAEQLGLSRPTMRRAMQDLVEKGLIVRRRGVGTRVVQPKVRRPMELTSLYEDLAGSGQSPATEVLEIEVVACEEAVATRLGITPGDPVTEVVRLRSAGKNPIAKLTNYLPESVGEFTAAELEARGLYEIMRGRGIHLHTASQTVGARNATTAEARLLNERRNAALLTMQRCTYDDRGVAVEYGDHVYAASRYSFEIDLLTP